MDCLFQLGISLYGKTDIFVLYTYLSESKLLLNKRITVSFAVPSVDPSSLSSSFFSGVLSEFLMLSSEESDGGDPIKFSSTASAATGR